MKWLARFAALLSRPTATATPVSFQNCRQQSAGISGPAQITAPKQRPDGAERTALIARRAMRLHNRQSDKAACFERVHGILARGRA